MAATIMTHLIKSVDIKENQILRYAGITGEEIPENVTELIKKCLPDYERSVDYKACFLEVPVHIENETVSFDCFEIVSHNLSTLLRGCDKAILVAATLGVKTDMLIKRAEVTSKAEALILNSIAIAGIEQYMAVLNGYFKNLYNGYELRPRYSPGYGDVALEYQKVLLDTLDTKRKIGVALSDSLLMTPQKSVSAIIGLGKEGCIHLDRDCELCNKKDCEYRL